MKEKVTVPSFTIDSNSLQFFDRMDRLLSALKEFVVVIAVDYMSREHERSRSVICHSHHEWGTLLTLQRRGCPLIWSSQMLLQECGQCGCCSSRCYCELRCADLLVKGLFKVGSIDPSHSGALFKSAAGAGTLGAFTKEVFKGVIADIIITIIR